MILNIFGRKVYVRKEMIALIVPIFVIGIGLIGYFISSGDNSIIIEASGIVSEKQDTVLKSNINQTPVPAASQKVEDEIKVYVIGSVNNPGIVTLKKGQIIDEAIKLAGGASENADLSSINLVYKLKDNVMIYIKSREESNSGTVQQSQKWSSENEAGPGIEIISDSAGAVMNENVSQSVKKKVNINSATENELDSLPGIGIETAKDIIACRNKIGGFKTPEDIMKVSGIKESRFSKIKDFITLD